MTYYLITDSDSIKGVDDGVIYIIPADPNNKDYATYLAWLDADPENQPLEE